MSRSMLDFFIAQAFARQMTRSGGGSVVAIGSNSGFILYKLQPRAQYRTDKAALRERVKLLTVEFAPHRIRVDAMVLGYVMTEMTKHRLYQPRMSEALEFDSTNTPFRGALRDCQYHAVPGQRRCQLHDWQHHAGRWGQYPLVNGADLRWQTESPRVGEGMERVRGDTTFSSALSRRPLSASDPDAVQAFFQSRFGNPQNKLQDQHLTH